MRTAQQIKDEINSGEIEWFGRDKFIKKISQYLLNENDSKHICLKGIWGSGKTTTIFGIIDQLQNEDVLTLYLDAWKYENYQYPTFAFLKAIEESNEEVYNHVKDKMKEKNLSFQAGLNLPFLSASLDSSASDHRIISAAEYISEFNDVLIDVIKQYKTEQNNKLIIFVDELDRAKPEFALRLLETFHHLYDELPTHFVYSVDINQLNSMIKHYYGYEYNTEIFLHKVFDDIIPLAPLEEREMIYYLDKNIDTEVYDIDTIIELVLYHLDADQKDSLRSINYVLNFINKNICLGYFSENDNNFRTKYYLGKKEGSLIWGYVELLVVLICKSIKNPFLVNEFLYGRQCDKLADYILEKNMGSLTTLVYESYLYPNKHDNVETQDEFKDEKSKKKFTEGLERLFIPPKQGYGNKSVFSNIIL